MKARYLRVFRRQQTLASHAKLWAEPTRDYHITHRDVHESPCSADARRSALQRSAATM